MVTITRDKIIYSFSSDNEPAAAIKPGERVLLETHDCFTGQITSELDLISAVDFSRVNPATGPIKVEGAHPGDILVVDIEDIHVGGTGFMVTIPEEGAFGSRIHKPSTKVVPVGNRRFQFNKKLSFPIHPMIGVIGVTPNGRSIPCGEIDDHGGNMDAKVITKGSRIYFKVQLEGALIALGDVHAGMGDGEAVICGVEIPSKVQIHVDLVKSSEYVPPRPVVELDDLFITIGHGSTLDEAAQTALDDMLDLIRYETNMTVDEISMLISAVGDLRVCQIVDPQKTARVEMPRSILQDPKKPLFH
jgi:amidase